MSVVVDLIDFGGGRAGSLVWDGDLLEPDGFSVGVDKKDSLRDDVYFLLVFSFQPPA